MSKITIEMSFDEEDLINMQNELELSDSEFLHTFFSEIMKKINMKTDELEAVISKIKKENPYSQNKIIK